MKTKETNLFTKLFIVITLCLGTILSIVFMLQNAIGALVFIMMIPGLMALILTLIESKSMRAVFAPFSHRISSKSVLFTFAYPLSIILLCALLALLTKQASLASDWRQQLTHVLLLILISVPCFFLGLFEEYGWRGYLLPRFIREYGSLGAAWRVGIMWSLYHLAAIFIINLQFGFLNAIYFTVVQLLMIFVFNFGFSYLYRLSANVILPSILHTLWNNVNVAILGDSYRASSTGMLIGNVHVINGEGLYGFILTGLIALLICHQLKKNP